MRDKMLGYVARPFSFNMTSRNVAVAMNVERVFFNAPN